MTITRFPPIQDWVKKNIEVSLDYNLENQRQEDNPVNAGMPAHIETYVHARGPKEGAFSIKSYNSPFDGDHIITEVQACAFYATGAQILDRRVTAADGKEVDVTYKAQWRRNLAGALAEELSPLPGFRPLPQDPGAIELSAKFRRLDATGWRLEYPRWAN